MDLLLESCGKIMGGGSILSWPKGPKQRESSWGVAVVHSNLLTLLSMIIKIREIWDDFNLALHTHPPHM